MRITLKIVPTDKEKMSYFADTLVKERNGRGKREILLCQLDSIHTYTLLCIQPIFSDSFPKKRREMTFFLGPKFFFGKISFWSFCLLVRKKTLDKWASEMRRFPSCRPHIEIPREKALRQKKSKTAVHISWYTKFCPFLFTLPLTTAQRVLVPQGLPKTRLFILLSFEWRYFITKLLSPQKKRKTRKSHLH